MSIFSGGTRIATSLAVFNKQWSRRVLTQGAVVLLITDGLERDPDDRLEFEIDRLHRSARRLVWLNPEGRMTWAFIPSGILAVIGLFMLLSGFSTQFLTLAAVASPLALIVAGIVGLKLATPA